MPHTPQLCIDPRMPLLLALSPGKARTMDEFGGGASS